MLLEAKNYSPNSISMEVHLFDLIRNQGGAEMKTQHFILDLPVRHDVKKTHYPENAFRLKNFQANDISREVYLFDLIRNQGGAPSESDRRDENSAFHSELICLPAGKGRFGMT
jgi:hypothetical protein